MAERTLDLMIARVTDPSRRTFGRILARHGTVAADVAKIRIDINASRLMVLAAADKIDKVNAKGAVVRISRQELARIAGCSREMAGRVLKKLEEDGLVSTQGRSILVASGGRLAEYKAD